MNIPSLLVLVAASAAAVLRAADCPLPPVIIDIHSHVFNSYYLPLREIVVSRGVPWPAAGAIELILRLVTGDSHLAEPNAKSSRIDREDDPTALKILERSDVDRRDLTRSVFPDDALNRINDVLTSDQKISIRELLGRPEDKERKGDLDREEITRAIERSGLLTDVHSVPDKGVKEGFLTFLGVVRLSERNVFRHLQNSYPEVQLFVHHMMDLERTFGETPVFPFELQTAKMIALQSEKKGKLLTFGAFDPFRGEASLELVQNAYEKGAVGIKFYPPSGYRPAENEIPKSDLPGTVNFQWESRYRSTSNDRLDRLCHDFFAYCAAHDIPIFSHCTPQGFEAVPDQYGKIMADPRYWRLVFSEFPKLRVCFAHAGGSGLWFGDQTPPQSIEFGKQIAELCKNENVYCDSAYWAPLLKDGGPELLGSNLKALLSTYPHLREKLMYGSDWFMLVQENQYKSYLCKMAMALEPDSEGDQARQFRKDFFAGNAARYLNLDSLKNDPRLSPSVRQGLTDLKKRLDGKKK